jgi:NhaP-type Na+/H+ or K+/H+ antiporter
MNPALWYVFAGCMLVLVALSSTFIERSPASPAMIYLVLGILAGPLGADVVRLDIAADAQLIELLAELAVLISVFVAGLKMATSIEDGRWTLPVRLAFLALPVTVALVVAIAVLGWGFAIALAVLLAGIVAPTDPVLASEVHVSHERDRDRIRFSLTGEAGLNDGTAFPFVILGLTLAARPHDTTMWLNWIALDLLWPVLGGLALGALCGTAVGHLVVHLRTRHAQALGLDEFLALGLIALAYGLAVLLSTYGFLAVFAAGLALRRIATPPGAMPQSARALAAPQSAADPATAPAVLAKAMLDLNTSLERLAEVGIVFLTGVLIGTVPITAEAVVIVALLLLVVRPLSIAITLYGTDTTFMHRALIGWFGVRGVGSLYYLGYAAAQGVAEADVRRLAPIVLYSIAASVIVHGVSVTPLMRWYDEHRRVRPHARGPDL